MVRRRRSGGTRTCRDRSRLPASSEKRANVESSPFPIAAARTGSATVSRGSELTATWGIPMVSSAKKTISESVFRRSCATKALSTRSADTTTPNGRLLPGSSTGTPTAWYSSSPASPGSSQRPLGDLPLHRAADQRAAGEVLARDAPIRRPRLEQAGPVGDEHPVGAGLQPQLVGLIQQIRAIAAAEGFADAGDVGGHLHQCLREAQQRGAPASQGLADGGGGRGEGARGGFVRGGVGAALGDQQRRAQHGHHD